MPQGPIPVFDTNNSNAKTVLNIIAATVVKATPGKLLALNVVTAGSTAGTINDAVTTTVSAGNTVASIPATAGPVNLKDWPFANGIAITPGTGQVISVAFV